MGNAFHVEHMGNKVGKDYVVGDIHGEFGQLMSALASVGFDKLNDRLFSVGDLIDRGPDSEAVLELTKEPWFFPVQGNHEQLMLSGIARGDVNLWIANGGDWFAMVDKKDRPRILNQANDLPFVLTVNHRSGIRFGICHAEPPVLDWKNIESVEKDDHAQQEMLWGRTRIKEENQTKVLNIDWVFCGHTPLGRPGVLGNTIFIDTGACFPDGYLTVINVDKFIENGCIITGRHNTNKGE